MGCGKGGLELEGWRDVVGLRRKKGRTTLLSSTKIDARCGLVTSVSVANQILLLTRGNETTRHYQAVVARQASSGGWCAGTMVKASQVPSQILVRLAVDNELRVSLSQRSFFPQASCRHGLAGSLPLCVLCGSVYLGLSGRSSSTGPLSDTTCRVTGPELHCQPKLLCFGKRPQCARWSHPCDSATAERCLWAGVSDTVPFQDFAMTSHSFAPLGNQ